MSIIFLESFDDGLTAYKWTYVPTIVTGRHGNGGEAGDYTVAAGFPIPQSQQITMGFAYKHTGGAQTDDLLEFRSEVGPHGYLQWNNDESMTLQRANRGAMVKSAAGTVPYNTWVYIEFSYFVSSTVGTGELRIDGASIGSATGQDTYYSGVGAVTNLHFGNTSSHVDRSSFDDFYVRDDTTFMGDIEVQALLPNGNGFYSNLTGSDADKVDNYLHVDEATPDGDTSYVESATEGDEDTYDMEALTAATGKDVLGIQVAVIAKKDDSGNKFVRPMIRTNSVDAVGTSQALGTEYEVYLDQWELNPDTAAAWTPTEIDALEVGQETRDS